MSFLRTERVDIPFGYHAACMAQGPQFIHTVVGVLVVPTHPDSFFVCLSGLDSNAILRRMQTSHYREMMSFNNADGVTVVQRAESIRTRYLGGCRLVITVR